VSRIPWFALVACWLLSFPSSAAQQNPNGHKPATRAVAHKSTPAARSTEAAQTAGTGGNATSTAVPKDTCDGVQERAKFAAANYELKDLHLDSAADQFLKLTASCDQAVKMAAVERFDATHHEMSRWWWQMGRHFPPLRWYYIHYPRALRMLEICLIVLLVLSIPLSAFWMASSDPNRYERLTRLIYGENLPGRTVIMTPSKLTQTTEDTLFSSMLQSSSLEVMRVLKRAGANLQIRSTALLSLPTDAASTLSKSLPTIKGVDLNGFVNLLFYLRRYFGWRVESQVGFCPATKDVDGTTLAPARIVASAAVRRAWQLKSGPWPVNREVDDQYDIDAVAFAIAVRIMGSDRDIDDDDILSFSDEKSFGFFMEGIRALQLYDEETSKEQPCKRYLNRHMQDALSALRSCVSQHTDSLPRFYLGVALAMRNQEVYVERVDRLASACTALGRELAFSDLGHEKGAEEFVAKNSGTEAAFARPFRQLEEYPWPLLEEAGRMFKSLLSEPGAQPPEDEANLVRAASYNLAQVYGRRGGLEFLEKGIQALDANAFPRTAKPSAEEAAIDLQFECLRHSLNLRHLMSKPGTGSDELEQAFNNFEKFEERIENEVDLAFKPDLTADYFTQVGYVFFESAIKGTPVPRYTAEGCLNTAANYFNSALDVKQFWNPAQIYLAVVRRLQSGYDQVCAEWEAHQKEELVAKRNGKIKDREDEIARIQKRTTEALASNAQADVHRLDEERIRVQAEIKKLTNEAEPRICSHQRSFDDRQRQGEKCASEAADLFAVLQGLPSPSLSSADGVKPKAEAAPKGKPEEISESQAA
jgi:hypothetical protein